MNIRSLLIGGFAGLVGCAFLFALMSSAAEKQMNKDIARLLKYDECVAKAPPGSCSCEHLRPFY